MAGQRFSAHGATITVDSVNVEGLVSITLPDETVGEAEITASDSGGSREFLAGLSDNGELGLEMRYIPGATGQANLRTLKAARTTVEIVITLPDSATDDSAVGTLTFDGYVNGIGGSLPVAEDEAAMMTASIRVSGDITEAVT